MKTLFLCALLLLGCSGGGAAGDGGAGGAGGAGAAGGGATGGGSGCDPTTRLDVAVSGSRDFDLHTVQLSGRVTLGGATVADGAARGHLELRKPGTKSAAVHVELAASGEATWSVRLYAGLYEIHFVKTTGCDPGALPCGDRIVKAATPFTVSGALDLDVTPDVTISGAVTVDGASMADRSFNRGTISFLSADGGTVASSELGSAGAAHYAVQLPAGTYDVALEGAAGCGATTGPLPCQRSVQRRAQPLTASGSYDLDVKVVTLTGSVRVNGQPLANSSGASRGSVSARDADGRGPSASLGATGPGSFALLLYAGAYDLRVSNTTDCPSGQLPCQGFRARTAMPVNVSGAIDLDLPVVNLSGQVTGNGQPLVASPNNASRGELIFEGDVEGGDPAMRLSASGPASYQLKVYAGTYAVTLDNRTGDCERGPLPCGRRTVRAPAAITASGVLDVDVPVVRVGGVVTVNGAALPDSSSGLRRGLLKLFGPSDTAAWVGPSGPAQFEVMLYPGTYRVEYVGVQNCQGVPCHPHVVQPALVVSTSQSLAVDLPVISVSGAVTVNGGTVEDGASARGELQFVEGDGGTVVAKLSASGPATYQAALFAGAHRVLFANTTDCANDGSLRPLPCTRGVELTQRTLSTSGSLDLDLPVVTLAGTVTMDGAQVPDAQSGSARGELRFRPGGVAAAFSARLTTSGPALYQVKLLRGAYDVDVDSSADCLGPLPCQSVQLLGCQ
ncbi:MAG: hypothetical protein IPJ65_37405 [Archangiaceae bacterium]|nr:hypothetical protein [Archangiaceae bacterium]